MFLGLLVLVRAAVELAEAEVAVGTPARISMATPPVSLDVDVTDDDPPASSSASSRTAASPFPEKPPVTAATLPPSNPLERVLLKTNVRRCTPFL